MKQSNVRPRRHTTCLVQARDGRWQYGPGELAEALSSVAHGVYATEAEANAAMIAALTPEAAPKRKDAA